MFYSPIKTLILIREKFKRGNINFGLAHGMLGPLIALAKAHAKGFNIEGLKDGIEKVYHLYEVFQVVNEEKIPCWPGPMTVEEYWNGTCNPENLHISSSWCYGNAGVMRGLQKVAGYMGWKEKEQAHVETMIRFFSQNIKTYDLYSPSLCHGFFQFGSNSNVCLFFLQKSQATYKFGTPYTKNDCRVSKK